MGWSGTELGSGQATGSQVAIAEMVAVPLLASTRSLYSGCLSAIATGVAIRIRTSFVRWNGRPGVVLLSRRPIRQNGFAVSGITKNPLGAKNRTVWQYITVRVRPRRTGNLMGNGQWAMGNGSIGWLPFPMSQTISYLRSLLPIAFCRSRDRSSASCNSRSTSSGRVTPEASHRRGYMLIEVNPGIVFTSLSST